MGVMTGVMIGVMIGVMTGPEKRRGKGEGKVGNGNFYHVKIQNFRGTGEGPCGGSTSPRLLHGIRQCVRFWILLVFFQHFAFQPDPNPLCRFVLVETAEKCLIFRADRFGHEVSLETKNNNSVV